MQYVIPLLAAAWWLGFIARDSWGLSRMCFYIPAVPVALLAGLWLVLYRRRTALVLRGFVAASAVAAAYKTFVLDCAWNASDAGPQAGSVRLVHWNTAWGRINGRGIWKALAADMPDIVLFSEPPLENFEVEVQRLLPGAQTYSGAGMALASRWPMQVVERNAVPGVRSWHIRIDLPGGPLDVLGVDIPSSPLRDRRRPLTAVARWVEDHATAVPLVVVGDFNTPRDSAFLDPLRRLQMSNAYEAAGYGWPYSWPLPLPMWAIDQIWVSRPIRVGSHAYRSAMCSDHRRQVVEFAISGSALPRSTQGR